MSGYDSTDRFRPPKVISQKKEDDLEMDGLREARERDKLLGRAPVRSLQAQVSTGRTIADVEKELAVMRIDGDRITLLKEGPYSKVRRLPDAKSPAVQGIVTAWERDRPRDRALLIKHGWIQPDNVIDAIMPAREFDRRMGVC